MNVAPFIPLAGCLCNAFFAAFVFFQSPRAKVNRVYLMLGSAIAVWNLGCFHLFTDSDKVTALFWARICFIGVIFTVLGFFHLSMIIAGFAARRTLIFLYTFQALLVFLDFTPLFIRDVEFMGNGAWYSVAGPALRLLAVPYAASFISLVLVWRKNRTLQAAQRRRLNTLLVAQVMLFVFGLNDLMPIIGVKHYPFTTILVFPYGSFVAVIYGMLVAYSVLHYQLLDVRVTLSRHAAHFIRFAFLFFITTALLLVVTLVSKTAFNALSFGLALSVFAVSSILTVAIFPRFFGNVGFETLERRILGDRFEYQDQVRTFIANMNLHHEIEPLFDDLHKLLIDALRVASYQIILRDQATRSFALARSHPEHLARNLADLKPQSAIFRYFEWGKGEYLPLNPASFRSLSALDREARREVEKFNADLCFALSSQNEPFGLLLVGPKAGGEPMTATDISLLIALVKTMGLLVNQIRLKTQVLQAQELDLLGRMSRGMAHDLNNLLTPVSTLLQLRGETGVFDEELLPVATRHVSTIRSYIREALFFSENLRPDFSWILVEFPIRQAVDVARNSRAKQVETIVNVPADLAAEADGVLIQRLVSNLVTNAIDASAAGSIIEVVGEKLVTNDETRDWLRIRVVDHGEGISKENLARVITPYFTTKNRGDENRGFGLGLAICRKIAALHGGALNIQSQVRRGTTVQIDLPARQISTMQEISPSQAA